MDQRSPVLLVDARNLMYRAIYASRRDSGSRRGSRSPFVIMLRMLAALIGRYQPGMVQVFWDVPRQTIWRKALLQSYKNRSDDHGGGRDISQQLVQIETIAREAFDYLNVYQFQRDQQEADDLIWAACKLQHCRQMVLVSSDSDMQQIPFQFDSVKIYNHDKNQEMPRPTVNPVLVKALVGDGADCITGYYGTGPVGANKLVSSPALLQEHLDREGAATFRLNLALIDMSLNPHVLRNLLYVSRVLATKPTFDRIRIQELEHTHKIAGLSMEYGEVVAPFKQLLNK